MLAGTKGVSFEAVTAFLSGNLFVYGVVSLVSSSRQVTLVFQPLLVRGRAGLLSKFGGTPRNFLYLHTKDGIDDLRICSCLEKSPRPHLHLVR